MTEATNIHKARALILSTAVPDIDLILETFGVQHVDYRKEFPDTPVTPKLAALAIEAKEFKEWSNTRIAKYYNLSTPQLHYALYNRDALKEKEMTLPEVRVIWMLKNTDDTQTNIAEECGVSQSFVHKIAKELGRLPDRKKRTTLSNRDVEDIAASYEAGTPITTLAKRYNVSNDTIYKRLRSRQ